MTDTPQEEAKLTEAERWDEIWEKDPVVRKFDPHWTLTWFHFSRVFERYLLPVIENGGRVIEAGCAGSSFLCGLAERSGRDVWGVDYSPSGLRFFAKHIEREGLPIHLLEGDLLAPDPLDGERFDAVLSIGLIEHFRPPSEMVAALSNICEPGGIVLTFVPNFRWFYGLAQRILAPEFYKEHVIMDANDVAEQHRAAGLEVEYAGYMGFVDPGLVTTTALPRPLRRLWGLSSAAIQWPLAKVARFWPWWPQGGFISPFIYVVARKPAATPQ